MRRSLGDTLIDLAEVLVPAPELASAIRIRSLALDLPLEVELRHEGGEWNFSADVVRWRWRTVFDRKPGTDADHLGGTDAMNGSENSLPIEQFVQALTTQLDRAQSAMALKARNLKLPLTFAVKDLQLELRSHIEVIRSEVRIRPAGPGDAEASVLHLSLTTITRPMIEENAVEALAAAEDPTVREALGDDISDEEQRRLEWAGIHTITQLRDLQRRKGTAAVERVSQLPINRLRQALERASQPRVSNITSEAAPVGADPTAGMRLRIRGANLLGENGRPSVRIAGQEATVLSAADHELVVTSLAQSLGGDVVIETGPGCLTAVKLGGAASGPIVDPENVRNSQGGPS